jgi:hypothetical protein
MTIALTLAFCLLSADPRSITANEARELAVVAAGPHNRGLSWAPYANPTLSAFYAFQGLRDAPSAESPNVEPQNRGRVECSFLQRV